MYLKSYEPWNALKQMQTDLAKMLGEHDRDADDGSSIATSRWIPAVDIKEEGDRFVITADVPGVNPKDIDVTMADGTIVIKGERKLATEEEEKSYRRIERVYGTFYRRFSLPDSADADKISAKCDNGVLEVVIPKSEKQQPRRIEVKA